MATLGSWAEVNINVIPPWKRTWLLDKQHLLRYELSGTTEASTIWKEGPFLSILPKIFLMRAVLRIAPILNCDSYGESHLM